jgi:NAD(P)-dependent dehydrogenase (short-subunit alcohol dehydrogenase family)
LAVHHESSSPLAYGRELEGRRAVVTGGLSGIGRAIATLFSQAGADVTIFDASEKSRDDRTLGDEVAAALDRPGRFVQGDVSAEDDVARLFDEFEDGLDIVVNNAGITAFKPIEDLTAEDFDRVMAVNVRGTFLMCRRAIAGMRARGRGGTIVNVASNFGFVGEKEASVYCASKGAVATMSKALAVEAGPDGIRVNALCPGATATEFNRAHRARSEVVEAWRDATPLRIPGREDFLGTAADVARAALFLASDASIYMTGAALICDGGWNAR